MLPEAFRPPRPPLPTGAAAPVVDALLDRQTPEHTRPSAARALRVAVVGLAALVAPDRRARPGARGRDDVFAQIALFFSKLAVVTFGGAYAVLAYMAQQAVENYGWLAPGEMLDGLGMAETTPGPLIQVVQFVGFLGAYREPGRARALARRHARRRARRRGSPTCPASSGSSSERRGSSACAGAPRCAARSRGSRRPSWAWSLNLAIWFSLHTLFATVTETRIGPLVLQLPAWATLDLAAAAIAVGAALATLRFHVGMLRLIAACAALGALWRLLGPGG